MSILPSKSDSAVRHRSTGPLPTNANDAVLRATGVLSLLAIGTIHFLQIVPTTEATPLLGVSFLILIAACLAVAGRLAIRSDHRTWMASAVVCAAAAPVRPRESQARSARPLPRLPPPVGFTHARRLPWLSPAGLGRNGTGLCGRTWDAPRPRNGFLLA